MNPELEQDLLDLEYENTTLGSMPKIAQLAGLGAQQTMRGIRDVGSWAVDAATGNDEPDLGSAKRWKEINELEKRMARTTGSQGIEDIDMFDSMARYIPEMGFDALTLGQATPAIAAAPNLPIIAPTAVPITGTNEPIAAPVAASTPVTESVPATFAVLTRRICVLALVTAYCEGPPGVRLAPALFLIPSLAFPRYLFVSA